MEVIAKRKAFRFALRSIKGVTKMITRHAGRTSLCFVWLASACVFAQNSFITSAAPAATAPVWSARIGYSLVSGASEHSQRLTANGIAGGGNVDFSSHWGATLDSSYSHSSDVSGTHRDGSVLSLLSGPVFYPNRGGRRRVFIHALAGVTRVDAAVPVNGTYVLSGWLVRFSEAVGGGLEQPVSGRFALRIGADYLRAKFLNSADGVSPQNDLRVTAGLVFQLRGPRAQ